MKLLRSGSLLKACLILLFLVPFESGFGQSNNSYYNPKDDQYRLLGLKRAKEAFEFRTAEFKRNEGLFDKGLISKLEMDKARNALADAEVSYHQSLLAVLFEKQYVAVTKATKYQKENGQKEVLITLENTSGGGAEFRKLVNIEDKLFRSLQPDVVNNVYVSLLNNDDAIIGQPYEKKIARLKYGEPVSLRFTLLQDVDAITVNLIYGSGSQNKRKIFLQKDASVNKVIVQSEQFSQEVELGNSADFDLSLELFSGTNNTFKLEVVNLTSQINSYFKDPSTNARLSYFKFTESANTSRASLTVFLPDRPTEHVVMDRSIPFYVLVIPRDRVSELGDVRAKTWTEKTLKKLKVGFVRLELVPRGIGKLQVRATQLYHTTRAGAAVQVPIDLYNDGSRILNNVEITVDPPLNWSKEVLPRLIETIEIGEEKRTMINLIPPEDVAAGGYEIRIRTSSLSDNKPIVGEDKTVTVEILQETDFGTTAVILLLLIGVIGGIVVFGLKLSRR